MIHTMTLDDGNMFAMGNRFMRRLYTVYDRDNDRIGLAKSSLLDKIVSINQFSGK